MPERQTIKDAVAVYVLAFAAAVAALYVFNGTAWLTHHRVGAWLPLLLGVILLLCVQAVYYLGRHRPASRPDAPGVVAPEVVALDVAAPEVAAPEIVAPEVAAREIVAPEIAALKVAAFDLGVAKNSIKHVRDFTEGLRLCAMEVDADVAIPRLRRLRDLIFEAIIQGINTRNSGLIQCALYVPIAESGQTAFRMHDQRGDPLRVQHLMLGPASVEALAYTSHQPIYVPDARNDPRIGVTTAGHHVLALYCVPLSPFQNVRQDPLGVFSVASNQAAAFSEADRAFVSVCADVIAIVEFFIAIRKRQAAARPPVASISTPQVT